MEIKMKGIFKGLKIISQIFAMHKQHEMEIGCPTDVRHVSHIGVGASDSCPSWMSEFRGLEKLSAGSMTMSSFSKSRQTSWASQDFEQPPRTTFPTGSCPENSGQEAAGCCHDTPRGPKNPRRKKAARASSFSSSATSFMSRSRSSSFATACGDFGQLRGGLQVA
ncbi:CRIB domain-containing protein RIC10-like [Oryza brachyantha]|uniref:CRIB domain-containing protein n=1 Tax=Oryza brachyantha TaxID=4533 RepID=J3MGX1_ORYBR|nr:CRIB domain-containing protein RIC10-like [Oryza brachyantha]XP_015693425.1 CRIB domain-containing protein RIC10-like [Oryza brachyantha]